jgi:hypothetical protein
MVLFIQVGKNGVIFACPCVCAITNFEAGMPKAPKKKIDDTIPKWVTSAVPPLINLT